MHIILGDAPCADGQVRLQGGTALNGRVEVCGDGQWGSVCILNWDSRDAAVLCSMLGYPKS